MIMRTLSNQAGHIYTLRSGSLSRSSSGLGAGASSSSLVRVMCLLGGGAFSWAWLGAVSSGSSSSWNPDTKGFPLGSASLKRRHQRSWSTLKRSLNLRLQKSGFISPVAVHSSSSSRLRHLGLPRQTLLQEAFVQPFIRDKVVHTLDL